jgi:hypothetical protein
LIRWDFLDNLIVLDKTVVVAVVDVVGETP